MSFFDNLIAPFSTSSIDNATNAQIAAAQAANAQYQSYADKAYGTANQYGSAATTPWSDLYTRGLKGYDAYADATGANGPEGMQRAIQNFQAGPGFNFQLTQGLDALNRAGAAQGLGTGNILRGAQTFGSGLANTAFKDYVGFLQPFLNQSTAAATGLSNTDMQLANALSAIQLGQGNYAGQTQKDIGTAQAQQAMAPMQIGNNIWNAGMNLAKMALTAGTGMPTGGNSPLGGSLFGSAAGTPMASNALDPSLGVSGYSAPIGPTMGSGLMGGLTRAYG